MLYRDDLEEIVATLPSDAKLSLESRDYRYASVDEFAQHSAKPLHELELKVRDPYISIEFRPMWARIYVASSEPASAGVFYAINQILRRTYRRFAWCYTYYFLLILNALVIAHGLFSRRISTFVPYYWSAAVGWFLLALMFWILYVRLRAWSTSFLVIDAQIRALSLAIAITLLLLSLQH